VIHVRRWWPVPVLLATSLVVQKAFFESRYDVSGHAAEHLSSASVAFLAFALVAILLYVTPQGRRQPLVLVTSASWLVSTVLVLVGNVRVVDALVRAGMGDTPTSQLFVTDTIDSAHDLANLAPWLGVLTALALTGVLWRYRHVSGRVAIGATVLSLIVPPWIFPGAGVLVLTIARCIAYQRASPIDRAASAGTAFRPTPKERPGSLGGLRRRRPGLQRVLSVESSAAEGPRPPDPYWGLVARPASLRGRTPQASASRAGPVCRRCLPASPSRARTPNCPGSTARGPRPTP